MQKVKLFKGTENELESLEGDINAWIASSGFQVLTVSGNIAPQTHGGGGQLHDSFPSSDVLIIVTYEDAGHG